MPVWKTSFSVWRTCGDGMGRKRSSWPAKITTDMSELGVHGWFNSMPAYLGPVDMAGIKVVGGYADNHAKGAALYPFQYFTDKSA